MNVKSQKVFPGSMIAKCLSMSMHMTVCSKMYKAQVPVVLFSHHPPHQQSSSIQFFQKGFFTKSSSELSSLHALPAHFVIKTLLVLAGIPSCHISRFSSFSSHFSICSPIFFLIIFHNQHLRAALCLCGFQATNRPQCLNLCKLHGSFGLAESQHYLQKYLFCRIILKAIFQSVFSPFHVGF